MVTPDELHQLLSELHRSLRLAVARDGITPDKNAVNRKGDRPEACDLTADSIIRRFLRERFHPRVILSEEGEVESLDAEGTWQYVIDPVDGTNNFRRNLPGSTVCIAAISDPGPIAIDSVQWSMVGDYGSAEPAFAVRGRGAWRDGKKLSTSKVTHIEDACLHFELDHHHESKALATMLARAAAIRSYCSTAYAILLVASGAVDAHLDLRRRVTPESYLAASLVLTEAGGVIVDTNGTPLAPFSRLTDRRSILVAATRPLAEELLTVLRK